VEKYHILRLIKALMNSPNPVKWKFLVRELKKEGLSDESYSEVNAVESQTRISNDILIIKCYSACVRKSTST